MSAATLSIGTLASEQFDEVRALLQGAGLPTDDLAAARAPDFIVARDGARIAGAVALERHGNAEQRAHALGVAQLVLLTQTAEAFFARCGYEQIARSAAPAALRSSHEFTSLCPASAVCMRKALT